MPGLDNLYHFPCSEKSRLLSVYKADASNQREFETVFSTMLLLFTERCSVAGSARFYESYYVQVSASRHVLSCLGLPDCAQSTLLKW